MTHPLPSRVSVLLIVSGILLEWMEYSLYLYLGVQIAAEFFPKSDPASITLTFAIFATGYLVRPLGAWLYGSLSDRQGRKLPMLFSIWMMGIATLLIGLLPGFTQIGWWAPLLLLLLRMLQNFSIAGEFNNSVILLMESVPAHKKMFYGSWVLAAASFGMFLGNLIAFALNTTNSIELWRVAFIGVGLLSLIVCIYRKRIQESPLFNELQQQHLLASKPVMASFKHYKKNWWQIFILAAFLAAFVYTCGGFLAIYINQNTSTWHFAPSLYMALTQLLLGLLMPLLALFLYKYKPLDFICYPAALLILVAPALFYVVTLKNELASVLLLSIYALINATASLAIFQRLYELMPTAIRCSGVSIPYNLAVALVGGTAPLLAETFIKQGWYTAPGWYVAMYSVIVLGLSYYNRHE